MVKEGLGWRKRGWVGDNSLCWSFPLFEKTLTLTLILVAFGLVTCKKEVSEQAAKRDMSFYPLRHGKSLTERRTEILKSCSAQH
jgi:hypothetical protein